MADTVGMNRVEREACWRERIAACAASGLAATHYCREAGISVSQYYRWKWKLSRRDAAVSVPALFSEVRAVRREETLPGAPVEIALSGGRVVRVADGFDAATLARVVRVLEGLRC